MLTNKERNIIFSHIILSDIQSLDKLYQRRDNLLKELQAVEREIKRRTKDLYYVMKGSWDELSRNAF